MGIEFVLPTNPKVGIEVYFTEIVNKHYVRIYSTDPNGVMDNVGDFSFQLSIGHGDKYADLGLILKYCGIQDDPVAWLAKMNKEDAIKALLKYITEYLIPTLVNAVNQFISGKPSNPTVPYATPEELFQDIVIWHLKYNIGPDGKITIVI